jgi:hypothetical protein
MAVDISGFGFSARIIASNTFPVGFEITQFADDTDPVDIPSLQISDHAMGLNGNKINWTVANPIPVTFAIIAGTEDDRNLSILFEANRAGQNKQSAKDTITVILTYPDGSLQTLTGGSCDEFMPGKSVSSDGRYKSNTYLMSFENRVDVPL